jgi:hypothetical protein
MLAQVEAGVAPTAAPPLSEALWARASQRRAIA